MRRRLFNALTLASLVLFVPATALYFYTDNPWRDGNFYFHEHAEALGLRAEITEDHVELAPRDQSSYMEFLLRPPFQAGPVSFRYLSRVNGDLWRIDIFPSRLAMTALVLPSVWFLLWYRRRRKSRINMCAKCGYDLRASKDRCRECGEAIPPSAPASDVTPPA